MFLHCYVYIYICIHIYIYIYIYICIFICEYTCIQIYKYIRVSDNASNTRIKCVTGLIRVCNMTRSTVSYNIDIHRHERNTPAETRAHWYVWHNSCISVTWRTPVRSVHRRNRQTTGADSSCQSKVWSTVLHALDSTENSTPRNPPHRKSEIPRYKLELDKNFNLNLYHEILRNPSFSIRWISGV